MALPRNGVAKEIRHYVGSLFIFLFVIGIIVALIQFPVLDTNKEVVMMLIGTISASIGIVVSTITGAKPDDVTALKNEVEKKNNQIDLLQGGYIEFQEIQIDNITYLLIKNFFGYFKVIKFDYFIFQYLIVFMSFSCNKNYISFFTIFFCFFNCLGSFNLNQNFIVVVV